MAESASRFRVPLAVSIGLIEKLGLVFERMHLMPEDDDEVCLYGMSFSD